MSMIGHFNALVDKHDRLEEEIHDAFLHFAADEIVAKLKKRKLQVSEEIAELKLQLAG